jgi:hypothetical protein
LQYRSHGCWLQMPSAERCDRFERYWALYGRYLFWAMRHKTLHKLAIRVIDLAIVYTVVLTVVWAIFKL